MTAVGSNSLKLLVGGFTMGWGPCLPYIAPLLVPYVGGTKTSWRAGLKAGVMFSLGRLLALAILGGAATVAFRWINRLFPPHRSGYLHLVTACLMIALGILIVLGKGFSVSFGKMTRSGVLDRGVRSMLFFGFLMGIAPCAPLVAVLTYIACVAEHIVLGVAYAVSFGIGASFAPIVLGAAAGVLPERVFATGRRRRAFQVVCGAILIAFGVELLYYVLHVL